MKEISIGSKIFKVTVLISALSLLSKVLGLIRDMALANRFGATDSNALDAYFAAIKAPNMLFYIISGALAAVVVPVFVEYVSKGEKKEAWSIFNKMFNGVTLLFVVIALLGMLCSPYVVKVCTPGLPPETAALAAQLARIMFPLLLFAGWASIFTGLLNANQIFGIPAFSSAVNNMVIIAGALLFGSRFGIVGVAYATVLAMAAMALIQAPSLYLVGYRYKPAWDFSDPGVRQVIILIMPAALGLTVYQAYSFIETFLASGLPQGTITVLNFANKLVQFPLGLFVVALGIAAFPTISGMVATGEREHYNDTVNRLLRVTLLGMLPASVGLIVLSQPIISLFYQTGNFNQHDAEMTALALLFYSIGLTGQALNIIFTKAFYAFQDTRTPVKITLVTVLVSLVSSLILIRYMQFSGLALANSLASLTGTVLFLILFQRKTSALSWTGLLKFLVQVAGATVFLALTCFYANGMLPVIFNLSGRLGLLAQVTGSVIVGIVVYTAVIFICRVEEFSILTRYIKKRAS